MGFPTSTPQSTLALGGLESPATEITPFSAFQGSVDAVWKGGVVNALAKVGRTMSRIAAANADTDMAIANIGNTAVPDDQWNQWAQAKSPAPFDEQLKALAHWSKVDPRTTGAVGQVVAPVVGGLTIFGVGSMVGMGPATLGVVEGHNDYLDSVEQGIDQTTALKKAAITGVGAFAGAYLNVGRQAAIGLGGLGLQAEVAGNKALAEVMFGAAKGAAAMNSSLVSKMIGGATINTGFGATSRFLTSKVLDDAGYKDMAAQYHVLDAKAIMADVILGAAFGALERYHDLKSNPLKRPDPALINDALETRRTEAMARGSAGIPADPEAAFLDANLQDRAMSAQVRGEQFAMSPDEAWSMTHGALVDPERVQLAQDFQNAYRVVYGDLANGEPYQHIGWSDISVPDHLRERFSEDRQASTRNQKRIESQLESLDAEANAIIERAKTQLPKVEGREPTQGEIATVLRNHDPLMAEAQRVEARRQELEGRLADAQASEQATLDKWRVFAHSERLRSEPQTAAEFSARFGMDPGEAWQPPPPKPEVKGEAPKPPAPPKAGGETSANLEPYQAEKLRQLAARFPDLEVEMPDGSMGKMSDLHDAIRQDLARATEDTKLFDVAVGCFLGTGR